MVPEDTFKPPENNRETGWQVAKRIFQERRMRSDYFGDSDLFREPAWDILLHLFLGQANDRGVQLESVPIASGLPASSALRWLEVLESKGLVFAYRDDDSSGQVFLRLSAKGHLEMTRYLNRVAGQEPSAYSASDG
jgi:hypothetical protein